MDAIKRAILNGRHLTEINCLKDKTWKEFFSSINGKKVFIFGLGEGASCFFSRRDKSKIEITGVIDNDKRKQGIALKNYFPDLLNDDEEEILVQEIAALDEYLEEDVVILITNLLHYEEIYYQLLEKGKKNIFSYLLLESNMEQEVKSEELNIIELEKIDKKKMVFYTMGGYSGHGKYIAEQIMRVKSDIEIVWLVRQLSVEVPKGVRLVYWYNRDKVFNELSTSKYIIIDDNILLDYIKKEEQILIQIKHWSSITLKTFGVELANYRKQFDLAKRIKNEISQTDYVFTGSDFDTRTFRKAYEYEGQIIEVGSPRSDILFDCGEVKNKVLSRYNINIGDRLLLFAPTFRINDNGLQDIGPMNMDYIWVKQTLERKFGGTWKILLRLHPNVAVETEKIEKLECIVDVSDYADSQELIAVSDILITDYSSIMFEPAYVNKPVFLFSPDRKEYINVERELLIKYDDLPFSIAETNEQLIDNIKRFDSALYVDAVEEFLDGYGVKEDGHASERAAEFILKLMD